MTLTNHTRHSPNKLNRPQVAVSACLLGHEVRYDGSQKQDKFVALKLSKWLDLVPVCPEVEIGMGVPRPPIHLLEQGGQLRAIGVENSRLDVTRKLNLYGRDTARRLENIDAYIFKARSPSCGVGSTPIKPSAGGRRKKGAGLFAAQIMRHLPLLPVVEEGGLETRVQQANFLQRVLAYRRWREFVSSQPDWQALMQFHQANRLLLLSHGARGLRSMAVWLDGAEHKSRLSRTQLQVYGQGYMAQFSHQATQRRHARVLRRVARLLRQANARTEAESLLEVIAAYSGGRLPLSGVIKQIKTALGGRAFSAPEVQAYLALNTEAWCDELVESNA